MNLLGILMPDKQGAKMQVFGDLDSYADIQKFEFHSTKEATLVNSSTYQLMPDYDNFVHCEVAGIALIQMEVTVEGSGSGYPFFAPSCGNGTVVISSPTDSTQRNIDERGVRLNNKRHTIRLAILQQCMPSSINADHFGNVNITQKHKIGIQSRVSSAGGGNSYKMVDYKVRVHFIPAAIGHDQQIWMLQNAGAPTLHY